MRLDLIFVPKTRITLSESTITQENARVNSLKEYNILDSISEQEYDDITRLASEICQTPISLISLIDDSRQWFKSHHGLAIRETPKEFAFCTHTIKDPSKVFVVPDSRADVRFSANPLVTGDPNVIFYAGAPLIDSNGYALGSLCVIDQTPKSLSQNQLAALQTLAKNVVTLIENRKFQRTMRILQKVLEDRHQETEDMRLRIEKSLSADLNPVLIRAKSISGEIEDVRKMELVSQLDLALNLLDDMRETLRS